MSDRVSVHHVTLVDDDDDHDHRQSLLQLALDRLCHHPCPTDFLFVHFSLNDKCRLHLRKDVDSF